MLAPILQAASGRWLLGKIEDHTSKPLSLEEIEAHLAEHERIKAECDRLQEEIRRLKGAHE